MKKCIFFILCATSLSSLAQQENTSEFKAKFISKSLFILKEDDNSTPLNDSKDKFVLVNDTLFKKIVDKDLSFLMTGNNDARQNGQIFINVTEPNLKISFPALKLKNVDLPVFRLNGDIKAGLKNSIASIFEDNTFVSDVGVNLRLNIDLVRFFGRKYGYYFTKENLTNYKKNQKIESSKILAQKQGLQLLQQFQEKSIELKYARINEISSLLLVNGISSIEKAKLENEKAELFFTSNILKIKIDSLEEINNNFDKVIENKNLEIAQKAVYSTKRFYWATLIAKVNSLNYTLYDSTKTFSNRLNDKIFVGSELGGQINYYSTTSQSWFPNLFLSIGLRRIIRNNLDELKKIEVVTTQVRDTTGTSRTITDKTTAFNGNTTTDKLNVFNIQAIKFLDKNKQFGINLEYQLETSIDTQKQYQNFYAGFIFTAQDAAKEKQKYNVELFVNFNDIENTKLNADQKKWTQRNKIGIRLGIPIGAVK